jgi:hypothetical protein
MDDLFAAAGAVEQACRAEKLRFCFIGGIAVIRWGIPRVTRDLDWSDIESVCKRRQDLDWTYVTATLSPLAELKPDEPIVATLAKLRARGTT